MTRRTRRIAVVTGSRAEYGLLRSTIRAIDEHPRLELQLVVTGMHLLKKFGNTVDDIRRDGWPIYARIPMQMGDDRPLDQAVGLARGVNQMARCFQRAKSDIVLVLGDRIEALAAALAAVTTHRLVAHVHGGDVAPGDLDDSIRHAITKLAHLHLPATQSARRRILQLGESPQRVHVVGAPGLDRLFELQSEPRPEGSGPPQRRHALIVQHPLGRAAAVERRTMTLILDAVHNAGLAATCIYPNTDQGHTGIVAAIRDHQRRVPRERFTVVRSLDHDAYLRRLLDADLLIGNSSSGIIEAPLAGTPAVNVGLRQLGREHDEGVFDADETAASIRSVVRRALGMNPMIGRAGCYGNGQSGVRIARLLTDVPLHCDYRRKVFADAEAPGLRPQATSRQRRSAVNQ